MTKDIKQYKNRQTGEVISVNFNRDSKGKIWMYWYEAKNYSANGIGDEALNNFNNEYKEV